MPMDRKYGKVTVEKEPGNPFLDDEPLFIIRGRDKIAIPVIMNYQGHAVSRGCDGDFIDALDKVVEEFEQWQEAHSDLIKLPD